MIKSILKIREVIIWKFWNRSSVIWICGSFSYALFTAEFTEGYLDRWGFATIYDWS